MKQQGRQYRADEQAKISLEAIRCRQRSTLEKGNALEEGQKGDVVGRPSWRSSLLGDPGAKFLCGKPNI